HRPRGLDGGVLVREARGEVADEQRLFLGERRAGSHMPNHLAAVSMSLSPRPDRLTSMIASVPSAGPIWRAPASACADSIAGMMPSVRQSVPNASIACASVIER